MRRAAASLLLRGACAHAAAPAPVAQSARGFAAAATSGGASRASALLLLLPSAVATGLGAWQLQRREWKVEQLAERARQLAAEPLPVAALASGGGAAAGEWRRVLCKGELRHEAASYVGPRVRTLSGTACAGYLLVEPLVPADGSSPVLLNRGWVPAEWRTAGQPSKDAPCCVAVTGVVRASEKPSAFVPANAGNEWFWIDVPALAAAANLPPSTPLVEVVVPAGHAAAGRAAFPLAQEQSALLHFPVMPDDHRNYAATWFTLAAAVGVIAARAIRSKNAAGARAAAQRVAAAAHSPPQRP